MKKIFCTLAIAVGIVAAFGAWAAGTILISPWIFFGPMLTGIFVAVCIVLWAASSEICDTIRDRNA